MALPLPSDHDGCFHCQSCSLRLSSRRTPPMSHRTYCDATYLQSTRSRWLSQAVLSPPEPPFAGASRTILQPHNLALMPKHRFGINHPDALVGVFAYGVPILDDRAILQDIVRQSEQPLTQL